MQQPELGRALTALRKEKNLTQEELVEKSHVSVRTIQRIEAGEVMPRVSTVKILWNALGENYDSFSTKTQNTVATKNETPNGNSKNTLLIAVFAGAIYLVVEIMLGALDIAWFLQEGDWQWWTNMAYIALTVMMVVTYFLFIRGFLVLAQVFENGLLKIGGYLLIAGAVGLAILDISSLATDDVESLWIPYSAACVSLGAMSIIFGVALIRLQDGMGELSRFAGLLEIVVGCAMITVVLFFIGFVVMVPAVIVEILLLYRGYEYLSKSKQTEAEGISPLR
jgi:transcriptional regulator with XRE-family HTH domain